MSHKEDKKRAAAGEVFREGKVSKMTRCPVPDCQGSVITGNSAHGLCPKHEEDLTFLLFILPRIRIEHKPDAPGVSFARAAWFSGCAKGSDK